MPEAVFNEVLFFLAGWAAARLMLPGVMAMIAGAGFLRTNYRGEEIPSGLGVVFFLSGLAVISAFSLILPGQSMTGSGIFLAALSGFTCLGLIDDLWGSGGCRGLAGHAKILIRGRLTTGSLKALAGLALAVFLSAGGDRALVPLNALVIALSVNVVNLLDLRPGRAGKCFLLLAALILAAFPGRAGLVFLAAAAGSLVAYLPMDLKARAMMGDTGSNVLGAVLGLTAVWTFDLKLKVIYLVVLVLVHLLAEKYSITRIISGNRLLDYLDRLGRE